MESTARCFRMASDSLRTRAQTSGVHFCSLRQPWLRKPNSQSRQSALRKELVLFVPQFLQQVAFCTAPPNPGGRGRLAVDVAKARPTRFTPAFLDTGVATSGFSSSEKSTSSKDNDCKNFAQQKFSIPTVLLGFDRSVHTGCVCCCHGIL